MAFHNDRFPITPSYGYSGGPGHLTRILETETGQEHRVARISTPRWRFQVPMQDRDPDEVAEVVAFLVARGGALNSFLFKDMMDWTSSADGQSAPTAVDQYLGVGDGVTTRFALTKAYSSGGHTVYRPITRPVDGTVLIAKDGVATSSGWSLDGGEVVFTTAPAVNEILTSGFEFDVEVRLDAQSDKALRVTWDGAGEQSIEEIELVEVVDATRAPSGRVPGGSRDLEFSENITLDLETCSFFRLIPGASDLVVSLPSAASFPAGPWLAVVYNAGEVDVTVEGVVLSAGEELDVHLIENAAGAKGWVLA